MSSQYQSTYTQSFSSQTTHSVEQQELQQEPLQSGTRPSLKFVSLDDRLFQSCSTSEFLILMRE